MPGYFSNLDNENFMSLMTFRKNGEHKPTPVWFVEQGGILYVTTQRESWKVKRIRNNSDVEVAPCNARGEVHGDYVPAQAQIHAQGTPEASIAQRLLADKYGWQMRLLRLYYRIRGRLNDFVYLQVGPRAAS